jgi:hypothetical protein
LLRNLLRCLARALATFALMLAGHDDGLAPVGAATPKVAGKWEGTWMHRAGSHGLWLYLRHTETLYEFGIEALFERPSYQDLIVTPVGGLLLGALLFEPIRIHRDHLLRLCASLRAIVGDRKHR